MNDSPNIEVFNLLKLRDFIVDTLTSNSGVSMNNYGKGLESLIILFRVLSRFAHSNNNGVNDLQMRWICQQTHLDFISAFEDSLMEGSIMILDISHIARDSFHWRVLSIDTLELSKHLCIGLLKYTAKSVKSSSMSHSQNNLIDSLLRTLLY